MFSRDNDSEDGSNDESEDGDQKLPATSMPPRKLSKSTLMKSPTSKVKPSSQRKKNLVEQDVESVAKALTGISITQKDGTKGIVDVTQAHSYIVWVVAKPERNVNYAHVRMQLDSDTTSNMITCKIADDGWSVEVTIKKPLVGALLDPKFLLMQYTDEGYDFDKSNPVYVALHSLQRAYIEDKEYFTEKVVKVHLPFVYDKSSFYNMASVSNDEDVNLGFSLSPLACILVVPQSPKGPHTLLSTSSCSLARSSMRRS
jgi:hypothetical protein